MHVIHARNVNDAYYQGLELLTKHGEIMPSRAGQVFVYPTPVMTVYEQPMERVLFDPTRDANPFFHLGEALWMLAGRNDATWLDQFVGDFSQRFAEDGVQHGAYGHRWRRALGFDQLDHVVETLRRDPTSRQCVIQMWDAYPPTRYLTNSGEADCGSDDLRGVWKDRPCNTHIYLRVRADNQERIDAITPQTENDGKLALDITVCCRSNDAVWGAYGANAVHFSVLQEYLARCIGVGVGRYYQLSNNFHLYADVLPKVMPGYWWLNPYVEGKQYCSSIVTNPETFDKEVGQLVAGLTPGTVEGYYPLSFENKFLQHVAWPMLTSYCLWRGKDRERAYELVDDQIIRNTDWGTAARQWYNRRLKAKVTV